jgi:hypothetical protein
VPRCSDTVARSKSSCWRVRKARRAVAAVTIAVLSCRHCMLLLLLLSRFRNGQLLPHWLLSLDSLWALPDAAAAATVKSRNNCSGNSEATARAAICSSNTICTSVMKSGWLEQVTLFEAGLVGAGPGTRVLAALHHIYLPSSHLIAMLGSFCRWYHGPFQPLSFHWHTHRPPPSAEPGHCNHSPIAVHDEWISRLIHLKPHSWRC